MSKNTRSKKTWVHDWAKNMLKRSQAFGKEIQKAIIDASEHRDMEKEGHEMLLVLQMTWPINSRLREMAKTK